MLKRQQMPTMLMLGSFLEEVRVESVNSDPCPGSQKARTARPCYCMQTAHDFFRDPRPGPSLQTTISLRRVQD